MFKEIGRILLWTVAIAAVGTVAAYIIIGAVYFVNEGAQDEINRRLDNPPPRGSGPIGGFDLEQLKETLDNDPAFEGVSYGIGTVHPSFTEIEVDGKKIRVYDDSDGELNVERLNEIVAQLVPHLREYQSIHDHTMWRTYRGGEMSQAALRGRLLSDSEIVLPEFAEELGQQEEVDAIEEIVQIILSHERIHDSLGPEQTCWDRP